MVKIIFSGLLGVVEGGKNSDLEANDAVASQKKKSDFVDFC